MLLQILDVDYFLNNGKPVIRIFGKTEDGKAVCCFFDRFLPYFYLRPRDGDLEGTEKKLKAIGLDYEEVEKFLPFGYQEVPQTVIRVILTNPQDVPRYKEMFGKECESYEADILFKYRFMADIGLRGLSWIDVECEKTFTRTSKLPNFKIKKINRIAEEKREINNLRYLSLDIECLPLDTSRTLEARKDPIIIVSMAFKPAYKGMADLVMIAKPFSKKGVKNILSFTSEKEMLERCLQIIDDFDPDVLTGYNINNFDIPYLLERLQKEGLPQSFGRCDKPVFSKTFGSMQDSTVTGRVVVDPYQILKRDPNVRLHRYNLDTVARVMLNEQKDAVSYGEIPGLWAGGEDGMNRLIEYARKDATLSLRLLLEKNMLDMFFELSRISGVLLQDSLAGQSVRIENTLLHEFKKRNILMATKPTKGELERRAKEKLKGATVLEPKKGLYSECVLVLDFQSLYPSIIKNYNISPDSLIIGGGEGKKHHVSPVGAKFIDEEIYEGVFPNVLKNLLAARAEVKKRMKAASGDEKRMLDARQGALKILANSFYGYCGYIRARLYRMEIANAITAYGRENIEQTKQLIEETFPVEVVYGDSVTADRFVTIMDGNGQVMIKNIEEFFEENREKARGIGGKEVALLDGGHRALAMDTKTGQVSWGRINKIIRHRTDKKVFRVGQKFGETVATEDHSLIAEEHGRFIETKPLDMADKKMVRLEEIPGIKMIEAIDLYEILKPYFYKIQYKGREKKVEVKINPGHVYFGWTARENPIRIKQTLEVESEEFEALCRLIGAYISEGSSSTIETTTRFGASIASSDLKWLEQLKKDYELLFENAKACIVRSTKKKRKLAYVTRGIEKNIEYEDKTHKLQMMNSLAAVMFKMLCGQTSGKKKLPDFAFHLPRKYQKIILENMIKGDGSFRFMNRRLPYSSEYKKNNFRYETKSLHLASGLSLLLTILDIKYGIRYRPDKGTYIFTTASKYNSVVKTAVREEKYGGYVYDMEVDESHTFVDSCGQILLHNTDSIFINSRLTDIEKASELGEQVSKFVSEKGRFNFEFEKIYRSFILLTKKRYAGWKFEKTYDPTTKQVRWTDSIEMRGIETVRRDWCPLVTETMENVLDIILKEGDVHKAITSVKDVLMKLNTNQIPLEKLTIAKGLTKAVHSYDGLLPHIELAKKMAARNPSEAPRIGDRVGFVIIRGSDKLSKRAEDPNYIRKHELGVDSDYYINNQLLPPIERILYAIGIERNELIGGGRQISIADIFGGIKSRKNKLMTNDAVQVGSNDIVCKRCSKIYRRMPLRGICECGGEFI